MSGYPPLPADVMPDVTSVEHLREALDHCAACARHLGKALDLLDGEPIAQNN
jgi:hypothetical protein